MGRFQPALQTTEEVEIIRLASGPQRRISENRRYALLVLGSFGSIVCSFQYAWNLISGTMQKRYNFSQRDLSTIVTTGLVVQHFTLPYAFLYDYLGPVPIAAIVSVYIPLGTLLLGLSFMGKIEGSVVRLSVFNAISATGCVLIDLVCCITVLSHFPTNRGPVTALLKTFTGLGSAIVACLYAGYFDSDPEKHLFFLFALALVVTLFLVAFMRLPPYHLTGYEMSHLPEEEKERRLATKAQYLRQEAPLRRFVWGFFILIVLIIFVTTQSALVSYLKLGKGPQLAFAIVATVVTLLYFVVAAPLPFLNKSHIPFFHPVRDVPAARYDDADNSARSTEPLECEEAAAAAPAAVVRETANAPDSNGSSTEVDGTKRITSADAVVASALSDDDREQASSASSAAGTEMEVDYLPPQYQGTFFHNLRLVELWALWWTMFCVVGSEFVIIYNARFILIALQSSLIEESLGTMLTVLNGVGSAVGRLLMSYFEVWTQKRKPEDRIPLTVALFFPTGSIMLSIVLFLVLPARVLPLPYIVAALGNGFCAATQLLVTRTLFAKDPAKHYHFIFTASLLSCLVFNRFLYGEWYTVQAEKQGRADKMCFGKGCVLMPMLVLLGLTSSAFISDIVLHMRYRSYCIKTLGERARLREDAQHQSFDEVVAGDNALLDDGLGDRDAEKGHAPQ